MGELRWQTLLSPFLTFVCDSVKPDLWWVIVHKPLLEWHSGLKSELIFLMFSEERDCCCSMTPWILFSLGNDDENVHIKYSFHLLILNHKKNYGKSKIISHLITTRNINLNSCFCCLYLKTKKLNQEQSYLE